ncbi:hypothetical protein [Pleurocapsa sp. FMAR1]|uniref:hypothetical protein n=1 Tax=Pleurocapsa sp. FMAR1 TaxID=3040204 RepID=UPI0029C75FE1|nr:hypothetical protein [Pleurocapsa sp. FMAR1]
MYLNSKNITSNKNSDLYFQQIDADENFVQLSPSINQPLKKQFSNTKVDNIPILFLIAFLLLTTRFLFKIGFQKASNNQLKFIEDNSKIACPKCYYYNNNNYLKCALYPDKVLTDEAKNCRDYQSKK